MTEINDPYWQAAAAHIRELDVAPDKVLAPDGFSELVPGCRTADDASGMDDIAAVIMHKGRLEQVPPALLVEASASFSATFANEVFVVLSRSGEPVAPDNPHVIDRAELLARALLAHTSAAADPARGGRMPATAMGNGRVLLETAFGHLMLVDGGDTAIVPHLIRDGWFDRTLTDTIRQLLRPGMTFIDIGANFGTYTLIGAERVGEAGRVIAIEPAAAIAALLFENAGLNGFASRAEVLRCALGEAEGTLTLYEFATRQGSNTMLASVADDARTQFGEAIVTREVACRTLDSIAAEQGLDRIDLIKIDVEGFEDKVLAGGQATLLRYRPKLILEWHSSFFDGRADAARAQHELLTGMLGYRLKRIEVDGSTRDVGLDELMSLEHSDLIAEPVELAEGI